MILNNEQIDLTIESRSVETLPKNLVVAPVSANLGYCTV